MHACNLVVKCDAWTVLGSEILLSLIGHNHTQSGSMTEISLMGYPLWGIGLCISAGVESVVSS